ncbi:MAG: anthranilate synthase component I family protein [Myxococcota bacterium]
MTLTSGESRVNFCATLPQSTLASARARFQPGHPLPLARMLPWPTDPLTLVEKLRPHGVLWLESAGGPSDITRFSLLGLRAETLRLPVEPPQHPGDAVAYALEQQLSALPGPPAVPLEPLFEPLPFVGGWIGAFSYELGRAFEHIPVLRPFSSQPPVSLVHVPAALVLDHLQQRAILVASLPPQSAFDPVWSETTALLDRVEHLLRLPETLPPAPFRLHSPLHSPYTQVDYEQAVRDALEHILAGDIYQVNLSQCFSAAFEGDAWSLYRRLREVSPAPFAAFLELDGLTLLSSSPELFLRRTQSQLETRPIKGTYRRGAPGTEDQALQQGLRADPKENAEHVMIVDMARNDLGRLAIPDGVEVPSLLRLEAYPQVHHLVSTVTAQLPPTSRDLWSLLRATFPGASITGAPKVQAMHIIERLERTPRGAYCGAFGYISRCGGLTLAMTIRTLVLHAGQLHMQVGGGLVVKSIPRREYEETLLKALGMQQALALSG